MKAKSKGSIFIVSAPSGAGKTTLCKKIISSMDNLRQSVSFTTRQPRPGEINGEDYFFVDEKKFRKMIEKGDFVEWAEVHGNLYGTSKQQLEGLMKDGFDVILDIDTQGARQIKNTYNAGVFIFILPPSMTVLRKRLEGRMSNTRDDMELRLKRAIDEMRAFNMYDYVIVNNILKESLHGFEAIISAERMRSSRKTSSWIEKNIIRR